MSNTPCCHCKACRKMRKKGLWLGSKWEFSWKNGGVTRVSAYVPIHYKNKKKEQAMREPIKDD